MKLVKRNNRRRKDGGERKEKENAAYGAVDSGQIDGTERGWRGTESEIATRIGNGIGEIKKEIENVIGE